MLDSRLPRALRKIVGFCGFHLSSHVEVENVVLEIYKNELDSSIPIHQFPKLSSHSLTNFAVNRNHVTTVMSQKIHLVVLCTRTLQQRYHRTPCTTLFAHQQAFFSVIKANRFHRNFEIAEVHHQEWFRHWPFDRTFHLLLLLDRRSMEMCSLQLLYQDSFSPIHTVWDCS